MPLTSIAFLEANRDAFWAKVDRRGDDDCWPWLGASRNGQGPTTFSTSTLDKPQYAYRLAFQYEYGPIEDGTAVRRYCGNKLCVNPNHLYIHDKHAWSPQEARDAHAAYMRTYYADPERREKKRAKDRAYAERNREQANQRTRAYYEANRDRVKQREAERQMRFKIKAVNYLGGCCTRCGFDHPSALQFHHRDPDTKSFNITSKELSTPAKRPWDTVIVPELAKCDLLCSNCHFLEHGVLSVERVTELKAEMDS